MKIADKITVSSVIVGLMVMCISGTVIYSVSRNALMDLVDNNLSALVEARTDNIELYLDMVRSAVISTSKSVILEGPLRVSEDDTPAMAEAVHKAAELLKRKKESDSVIYEYMILNSAGRVLAATDDSAGQDRSMDSYFLNARTGVYVKDAYYSEIKQMPLMAVSAPFIDSATGKLLGVLVARIRLDGLNKITTNRTGLGETGEIYIVNKYGYIFTPTRSKDTSFLKQRVDNENIRSAMLHAGKEHVLSNNDRIRIYSDYRGIKVLGGHAFLPELRWSVIAEIDVQEAFSPLFKMRMLLIIASVIMLALYWLLAHITIRIVTGPIRKLHRGIEIIGAGNLDHKVSVGTNDEIGELSRAFDAMVVNLKKTTTSVENLNKEISERRKMEEAVINERTFKESALNSINDVFYAFDKDGRFLIWNSAFKKVTGYSDEELRAMKATDFFEGKGLELIAQAIERIWKHGTAKEAADFVLKDGRSIPYEFTGALLKDGAGRTIGFSGTGRDLTERNKADLETRKRAHELEVFYQASVGREERIIELKKEMAELKAKLGGI